MRRIIVKLLDCFIVKETLIPSPIRRGQGEVNNLTIEQFNNRKGFTLIELIVAIAIIGVLATILVAGVSDYLARARDSKRISDLEEIKKTLITYYTDYGVYPEPIPGGVDCWGNWESGSILNGSGSPFIQELVTEGYLDNVPIEENPVGGRGVSPGPLTNNKCTYRYSKKTCSDSGTDITYAVLFANLETDSGEKDFRPSDFDGPSGCDWFESDPADPAQDKRDWAIFLKE